MPRYATVARRAILFAGALSLPAGSVLAQVAAPLAQEVREAMRKERSLQRLDVAVTGSEVTLTGALDSFWQKSEAIRRALDVDGVETVATDIELPPAESDEDLAEEVAKAVQNYPHYSLYDYLDGAVDKGTVSLWGRVTPDRDKAGELFERVAKIPGVQDVRSEIQTMTPSTGDTNLRRSLSMSIFGSTHFEQFRNARNPPFHIIVERSSVTLVGWVQGEIERREMEQIARTTQGVLRVDNQLQTIR
ncbi:MAG: BON domain-containing protein [Acidobacteria bacterium]|nr:BON domain-containing protein [Acidobacteriota bacterium]